MGGVGGMSPEYCRFRSMLSRSHYLISLLVYHTQKTQLGLGKRYHQGSTNHNIIILVILAGVAFKLGKLAKRFSSFNTCPSLPCVATDNEKQFQWLNRDWDIVFLMQLMGRRAFVFYKDQGKSVTLPL